MSSAGLLDVVIWTFTRPDLRPNTPHEEAQGGVDLKAQRNGLPDLQDQENGQFGPDIRGD